MCVLFCLGVLFSNYSIQPPSKKRKVAPKETGKTTKAKGKQRAFERSIIPIPERAEDNEDEEILSDQDVDFFAEHAGAGGFLQNLDRDGLARFVFTAIIFRSILILV